MSSVVKTDAGNLFRRVINTNQPRRCAVSVIFRGIYKCPHLLFAMSNEQ